MSIDLKNILGKTGFVFATVAFLLVGNAAFADTPDSLNGTTVVDAAKAKSLIDSGVMAIDARVANEYAESHIKGAINIPYKEKSAKAVNFDVKEDSFDIKKFPANMNTPVVIYCNGPECWKSYKASTAAVKAGYKTVYWFRGGLPEWKAKGYPTE
jgi:rhodanese-related sulfurtransferase